ncbi:hypothetical protein [Rhizobium sp.]
MTKEFAVRSDAIAVEVYMAEQNPPAVYDFYITRAGEIRRTPISSGIPGVIQVVMAGETPTSRQILNMRRQFELDERFQLMRFY